jgi:hypothetical protein
MLLIRLIINYQKKKKKKDYEVTFEYDLLLDFCMYFVSDVSSCTSRPLAANLNFLKADDFQFKFDCFDQKALHACKQV